MLRGRRGPGGDDNWPLFAVIVRLPVIVVLTHVAEMLQIFPDMGWGLPNSRGHYLDLVSAVLGSTLLIAGAVLSVVK